MSTLLLSCADLRQIVRRAGVDEIMDRLIERLADALMSYDPERTEIPMRAGFHYEKPFAGLIEWMPLLEKQRSMLMKVVGYHPESPGNQRLPTILSNLGKYDPSNGRLVALVDGTFLTAMRTGAASAVASRILAHPDSSRVGLIGCGAQSVTQLHALTRVFGVREVQIHDIDPAAEASFPARVRSFLDPAVAIHAMAPAEMVSDVDILCVATSVAIGAGPVFEFGQTRPWLHVNAVGSDFPGKIEVPKSLLLAAYVCPDALDQARREGECQQLLLDQIGHDLVAITQRSADFVGKRTGLTVFDSTGWALEDQVAMDLLLEYARKFGIGSQVQIEQISNDPRDPYEFLCPDDAQRADKQMRPAGDAA